MSNYLKSEWYRIVRKKDVYTFLMFCLLGPFCIALLTATTGGELYANTEAAFRMAGGMWSLLIFMIPAISMIIVGEEFTEGTLKNTIAYGISRETIFFGKWLMVILFFVIAWLVVYLSLTAGAFMLLENNGTAYFREFTASMAGVAPLGLGALTVSYCLCFLKEKTLPHIVIYALLFIFLPELFFTFARGNEGLLTLLNSFPIFPYAAANDHLWLKTNGMLFCWLSGLAYILLAFLISGPRVRRKEFR